MKTQTEETVVVGSDCISMFPSIKENLASSLCHKAILETEIEFENINYEEICIYIALNHSATSVPNNLRKLALHTLKT